MLNKKFTHAFAVFTMFGIGAPVFAAQCVPDLNGAVAGGCETEPSSYVVKIYEVGVCSAQPVAPTAGGAAADLSNCKTVFKNTAGSSITVQKGVSKDLLGTFTAPSTASYPYAYAILDPSFQIQASVTFQNPQTVVANDGTTPVAGKGSGVKCWTLNTTYRESNGTGSDTLDCGSSFGTAGTVTDVADILDGDSANPTLKQSCVTPSGSSMTACVTDSSLKQTTGATVTRFLMLYTNSPALPFVPGKKLDMAFGVSSGVGLISGSGSGLIKSMVAGPLDVTFSLK